MAYGIIKIDTITFTDGGIDKSVAISGLVQNPTFTGNVTVTGTVSGNTLQGQTISGVTVTGTTANFTSGNFTNISGGTHTITSGVFAAGTAANPSISFASDPNTGIYSPGADQVAISTNGVGRLFIDASGNVGINTSSQLSPGGFGYARALGMTGATSGDSSVALDLRGSRTVSGGFADINFWHQSTSNRAYIQARRGSSDSAIDLDFITSGGAGMRLDSSGRLGLGTSSPGTTLDVRGIISLGSSSLADAVIQKSAVPIGSYSLTITSGAGLTSESATTPTDALAGAVIKLVGGPPATDAFSGGIAYYANGHTSPNAAGIGNQHAFFTRSGVNTYAERMRIAAGGNVGVGTTSPSSTLDINGDCAVSNTRAYQVKDSGGTVRYAMYMSGSLSPSAGNDLYIGNTLANSLIFYTNSVERARIDSSGRLGLGTSSPVALLQPNGTVSITGGSGASSANGLHLYYDTTANEGVITAFHSGVDNRNLVLDGKAIGFSIAGSRKVTLTSTGLGIGTTTGTSKLTVADGSGSIGIDGGSISSTRTDGFYIQSDTYTRFYTSGAERARIDSSGRLLVGTSTARETSTVTWKAQIEGANELTGLGITTNQNGGAGAYLSLAKSRGTTIGSNTIVAADDALGAILFSGADGTDANTQAATIICAVDGTPGANDMPGRLVFSTTADGASSPTERMRITSGGLVRTFASLDDAIIGATGSAAGTTATVFSLNNAATSTTTGTTCFRVFTNGNTENTNNSYAGISDLKLKENIVDAASQWGDLKALQVRKYNFKEETGQQTHTQIGLIAQEVELVSPGLVIESPDRDAEGNDLGTVTKSVNYSVLYMKAVKALQEAMERIEALEAKVAALEAS